MYRLKRLLALNCRFVQYFNRGVWGELELRLLARRCALLGSPGVAANVSYGFSASGSDVSLSDVSFPEVEDPPGEPAGAAVVDGFEVSSVVRASSVSNLDGTAAGASSAAGSADARCSEATSPATSSNWMPAATSSVWASAVDVGADTSAGAVRTSMTSNERRGAAASD